MLQRIQEKKESRAQKNPHLKPSVEHLKLEEDIKNYLAELEALLTNK